MIVRAVGGNSNERPSSRLKRTDAQEFTDTQEFTETVVELIKTCTGSDQTGPQHWEREEDTGFNKEAICKVGFSKSKLA